jgi:amicyanin
MKSASKFTTVLCLLTVLCAASEACAEEVNIIIKDHAFQPPAPTIHVGDKVTWVNQDQDPHNIIEKSSAKLFHSPALDTNDSYSFTFTKAGTYDYFCTFHPMMLGKVIVQ